MKWTDLCSVPGQEQNCVQIIKYVVMYNIMYPQSCITMNNIGLENKMESIDWMFIQESGGEYLFCEMPSCWKIHILQDELFHTECDYHNLHFTVHFLNSLYKGLKTRPEWNRLLRLVAMLRSELPKNCKVCQKRNDQLKNMPPNMDTFVHHPLSDIEKAMCVARAHDGYMNILFQQTKQHTDIIEIIKTSFENIKSLYAEVLLSGKPDDMVVSCFRRDVIEALRHRFSFISTKPIDFKDWLYCLFYLDQLQERSDENNESWSNTKYFMRKLWLLLNLYFTEGWHPHAKHINIYIQDCGTDMEEIEMDTNDVERMKCTHPIERPQLLP